MNNSSFSNNRARSVGPLALVKWCPTMFFVLVMTLLVPSDISVSVGSLRLTVYKFYIALVLIPCLFKLFSGKAGKVNIVDWLIIFNIMWSFMVISHHHGFDASIEPSGVRLLEFFGAYLVARVTIVNEKTYYGAVAALLMVMCIFAPITIFESVTGFHVIRKISSAISGFNFVGLNPRMGFHRAFGSFDHPILYGLFAASLLGLAKFRYFTGFGKLNTKIYPLISVVIGAITSFSSGAFAALMTQFLIILWELKTKKLSSRWIKFTVLLLFIYFVLDIFSNRSGMKVILAYLTFSPGTAYNRINIFNFGMENVWDNPFWGIGFNDWKRPSWLHVSLDNFWLLEAMRYGIPGFTSLFLAVFLSLKKNWNLLPSRIVRLRTGWVVSMIGISISACTVHLWNNIFVFFSILLGMGGWFIQIRKKNNMLF